MRIEVGELTLDLTDEQAASLRAQLSVPAREREWLTADELAEHLGVSREFVYAHADELGGRRIGNGPKPRWRFPPSDFSQPRNMRTHNSGPARPDPRAKPEPPKRRRRKRGGAKLLAVRGPSPYAASNEKRPPNGAVTPSEGLDTGGSSSHVHD